MVSSGRSFSIIHFQNRSPHLILASSFEVNQRAELENVVEKHSAGLDVDTILNRWERREHPDLPGRPEAPHRGYFHRVGHFHHELQAVLFMEEFWKVTTGPAILKVRVWRLVRTSEALKGLHQESFQRTSAYCVRHNLGVLNSSP
jgi:hypothetical protein